MLVSHRTCAVFLLCCSLVTLAACDVNPYCLNCTQDGGVVFPDAGSNDAAFDSPFVFEGGLADADMEDSSLPIPDACVQNSAELCNNYDDDCDGQVDEALTPPVNFCSNRGECMGTPAVCNSQRRRWECDYMAHSAAYEAAETKCDGKDNDCDGMTDEPFPLKSQVCGNGIGACRMMGTYVCNEDQNGVACNAPDPNPPGSEACDGVDNDCDGLVDEPKSQPGNNASYVSPSVAQVGSVWMYQYEASRPDATAASQGQLNPPTNCQPLSAMSSNACISACSRQGVLPWNNMTYGEAVKACAQAGMRLCTESEWQSACQTQGSGCAWGMQSCTTYAANECNGNDYDTVAGGADDDGLVATGSLPMCFVTYSAGGAPIFDLSGNLKEFTQARGAGQNSLRGGSYNNTSGGMRCNFDFTLVDDNFKFPNVGFRCCSDTDPR